MKKQAMVWLAIISVTVLISSGVVFAQSSYLDTLNDRYSTDGTKLDDCITCHIDPQGTLNPYGYDLEVAMVGGANTYNALITIEPVDSDGDGFENGVELYNALTFPGDANDYPNWPICTDSDWDGFSPEGGECGPIDCNDNNIWVNPAVPEVCDDNIDNDCDGKVDCQDSACSSEPSCITCIDVDSDGYAVDGGDCGPVDCNDNDLAISPGAVENCTDLLDNDCDGLIDCADGDCSGDPACGSACVPEASKEKGNKCNDGLDNDCDGVIDGFDPDCGG